MSGGEYDEEYMFPVPRALFFRMRAALLFYERSRNYKPFRDGIVPVMRDSGKRAAAVLPDVDKLWLDHDQHLFEKELDQRHGR